MSQHSTYFSRGKNLLVGITAAAAVATFAAGSASAGTCIGNCGTLGPDGVVTAPPSGGPTYGYVTTNGGLTGVGEIANAGGTNGSQFTTSVFSSAAGDALSFYFNYVTSDGAGFSDYSFSELQTAIGTHVAWLFTARTTTSGDTSPGFGLPANDSTLTPAASPIVPGGPTWSPLGGNSGACYNVGCGYTGWIGSTYTVGTAGLYQVRFGVTNISDTLYQSGLAYATVTIGGVPVPTGTPEPATWALFIGGFGLVGGALRNRRRSIVAA